MTNNQWKCGIIYEKIAMRAGYDERMINYEWPCSDKYLRLRLTVQIQNLKY